MRIGIFFGTMGSSSTLDGLIQQIVDVDLAALRKVGGWLSRIRLVYTRVNAPALVEGGQ